MCVSVKLLQSCPTLYDPVDPSGSSVHGILQSRTLEWVAMPSSRGYSQPSHQTHIPYVFHIGRWVLYHGCHLGSPTSSLHPSKALLKDLPTPILPSLPSLLNTEPEYSFEKWNLISPLLKTLQYPSTSFKVKPQILTMATEALCDLYFPTSISVTFSVPSTPLSWSHSHQPPSYSWTLHNSFGILFNHSFCLESPSLISACPTPSSASHLC